MSCSLGVLLVAAVGLARHPNGCRGGPPVAPPTPFHPPGNWAGVKRSREQATGLAATKAEVRPALDADPAEHEHRPIMVVEGMGATSTAPARRFSPAMPSRPHSLLLAASTPPTSSNRRHVPSGTDDGFTHGMFGGYLGSGRHRAFGGRSTGTHRRRT